MSLPGLRLTRAVRRALRPLLGHTYSRVRVGTTPTTVDDVQTEDAWGNPQATNATAVTGLPCLYQATRRLRTDDGGSVVVDTPTLTVPHDDSLAVGDYVQNVADKDGTVLVAYAVVESFDPAAEAGASVLKVAVLRSAASLEGAA